MRLLGVSSINHYNLQITLFALTEQPFPNIKLKKTKFPFVITLFWFLSIVIVTSYKTKLTSIAINHVHMVPKTISELVEKKYDFYVSEVKKGFVFIFVNIHIFR